MELVEEQPRVEAAPVEQSRYAWLILVLLLFASIVNMMAQFKPTPMLPTLMRELNMSLSSAGLLTSFFAIAGLVLALPAGKIIEKTGLKNTSLIGMACVFAGSILGSLSRSVGIMLLSRVIEGIGAGLVIVLSSAAIARWFTAKRRGLAMGLWNADIPVGIIIMMLIGPAMVAEWGWTSVWWLTTILAAVAFLLFLFLFRDPPGMVEETAAGKTGELKIQQREVARKPNMWLLAAIFFILNFTLAGAIVAFYPTFLNAVRGLDMQIASLMNAVSIVGVLISAPIAGAMVDRFGARRLLIGSTLISVIVLAFPFQVTSMPAIVIVSFLMGLLSGPISASCMTAVVEALEGKMEIVEGGMAMMALARSGGMVFGPALMGPMVVGLGWIGGGWILFALMIIAFLCALRLKLR